MRSLAFPVLAVVAAGATLPAAAQHDVHAHHAQRDASAAREDDAHARNGDHAPAPPSQSQPPFPAPTAAERASAFPPGLDNMDMREHMDDNPLVAVFRGDRLEHGDDTLGWDLRAGIGRNFDKLWLRSEGERRDGGLEHASTELYWSHATGPWWDRTIGLRHDSNPAGRDRDWAAIGVQGMAPYKFEVEATGYIGTSGRMVARLEGEYELLLTNRWILQPKLEANLYSRDDEANHVGKGLSDASFGLRLRYEFSRRLAPYVGHVWTRRFGGTADFVEAAGGEAGEHAWVAGVRFWF